MAHISPIRAGAREPRRQPLPRPTGPISPPHLVSLGGLDTLPDDDTLMARVAAGNAHACAVLVDRHLQRVVNLATRVLGDRVEAEDVAQDAFVRVWTKADSWQPGRARLTTWLHRVTVNLCIDRQRRKRGVALDAIPEPVDPTRATPTIIAERQTAERVQQAIAELPERQRIAILLCHTEGHSNIEAAEILEVSVEAVESLLARGRRALRNMLADEKSELLESS